MTGKMSRSKGLRGEREVFKLWEAAGGVVLNLDGQGDHHVELDDVIYHVEAKRQETLRIHDWLKQAESEAARPFYVPVVCWRRSREPWHITMRLDLFLEVAK